MVGELVGNGVGVALAFGWGLEVAVGLGVGVAFATTRVRVPRAPALQSGYLANNFLVVKPAQVLLPSFISPYTRSSMGSVTVILTSYINILMLPWPATTGVTGVGVGTREVVTIGVGAGGASASIRGMVKVSQTHTANPIKTPRKICLPKYIRPIAGTRPRYSP